MTVAKFPARDSESSQREAELRARIERCAYMMRRHSEGIALNKKRMEQAQAELKALRERSRRA